MRGCVFRCLQVFLVKVLNHMLPSLTLGTIDPKWLSRDKKAVRDKCCCTCRSVHGSLMCRHADVQHNPTKPPRCWAGTFSLTQITRWGVKNKNKNSVAFIQNFYILYLLHRDKLQSISRVPEVIPTAFLSCCLSFEGNRLPLVSVTSQLPSRLCCVTAQLTAIYYSKQQHMWPESSCFCC